MEVWSGGVVELLSCGVMYVSICRVMDVWSYGVM